MSDPARTRSEISLGPQVVAWQAHCQHCWSAYLVAHREQSDGARPLFCAVCSARAIYTRLDGHK